MHSPRPPRPGTPFAIFAAAALVLASTGCAVSATGPAPAATTSATTASPTSTLATPEPSASPTGPVRVVGLGDSVMVGTNCGCDGPVPQYAAALAARTGRSVQGTDEAANGATAASLAARLGSESTLRSEVQGAGVVLVTVGANDLNSALAAKKQGSCPQSCWDPDVTQAAADLSTVLDRVAALRPAGAATVLVSNYWNVFTDGAQARNAVGAAQLAWNQQVTAAANAAFAKVVAAHHMALVDLVTPFRGADGDDDPTDLLATDGDHPSAAGVKVLVNAFLAATPALTS